MSETMNNNKKLRIFFIPFFASGHMIPMADLATLCSRREDVDATLCLTPANADFLRPSLAATVNLLVYPFPSAEAGLAPGQENLSSVTPEEEHKVYKAVDLSQPTHRRLLEEHRPDAVIADVPFWWTTAIARDFGIPRITWHAVGVFPQLVLNSLHKYNNETISAANDVVVKVKDFPGPAITMPVSELPEFARTTNFFTQVWKSLKTAQLEGYGVVVNSCYDIEPEYCDHYRATDCKKAWFVGPVALAKGAAVEREHECLEWLDGKKEGSVVFVCFGSWCQFSDEQLREMAVGLEKSGKSFVWVVRKGDGNWKPDQDWEKRVGNTGKIIVGWVPQVAILDHKAVGGFMTHCGWNSVLEAVAAGVPMLTWPLVFEQFINERLVVEVMGAGRRVSEGFWSTREEEKVVVPAEVIAKTVKEFMEEMEGEGAKKAKARRLAEMAKAAVADGGSSTKDLDRLIDDLKEFRDGKLK